MPPTVDVTKKYTVSELRTLRTAYAKSLDTVRKTLDPLRQLRDTVSSEIKQATNPTERERGRLAGLNDAVNLVQTQHDGLTKIMDFLNAQHKVVPKYKRKDKKAVA